VEHVSSLLATTRFRWVRWVGETGSTNTDAMALARAGEAEGHVVVADHQRAGRGRLGRVWTAPPESSLLVSVLLRPPAEVAGAVAMAVGLAMAEAIEERTGVEAGLKWPNDLVVVGRAGRDPGPDRPGPVRPDRRGPDLKLAGILAEADWPAGSTASGGWRAPGPGERAAVVAGVGVNVNWPDTLPDELAVTATALNHLVGGPVDRAELLVAYLRRLDARYGDLVRSGSTAALIDDWRARSATLGRRVRIDLGPRDVEGTAVDVTAEGHLVVETPDGERHEFAVGDVVHLRPR
jgi:BirA family biotin operon repressor/biotin-[acetyl-CoA-carboxylase] ligase